MTAVDARIETEPVRARHRRTRWIVPGLAGLWLLWCVAQRLFSGHFWLFLLPDLVPPLVYAVVPVVVAALAVCARGYRWPVIGAAVLALVVQAPHLGINPAAVWPGRPAVPASAIRVFTWNTEYWDQDDPPDRFYAYLRSQHADVYLLQEYGFRSETAASGLAPTGDDARLAAAFPGYHVVISGELVTLSRFPVVATIPIAADGGVLPAGDWAAAAQYAKVLRVDLDVRGTIMSAYNVHLPVQLSEKSMLSAGFYRDVHANDDIRHRELSALTRDMRADPHPMLVAGDFNTTPAMGDIGRLKRVASDAIGANRDLYPQSWGSGDHLPVWRLDWAFVRGGTRVYRYSFVGQDGMSDHRAQTLILTP